MEESMSNNRTIAISATIAAAALLGVHLAVAAPRPTVNYDPPLNPANFASPIDNKYFTLKPGTKYTFQKQTSKGTERTVVEVTKEAKKIMGSIRLSSEIRPG
jgi:hypothetical protein